MRSLGSTTAITYACRVGTSICESAKRESSSTIAEARLGAKATAASSRFEGRWVKTIVRRRPILPAKRTASWNESACRIPIEKKTSASACGEASYLRAKR